MIDFFQAYSIEEVFRTGVAALIVIAGLATIGFVIWGGFLMIISGGNEEKVKVAVNYMRNAIIGVILIIVILYVIPIFFSLLGLPYGDYMTPSSVFEQISTLSNQLFGQSVQTPPAGNYNSTLPQDFTDL